MGFHFAQDLDGFVHGADLAGQKVLHEALLDAPKPLYVSMTFQHFILYGLESIGYHPLLFNRRDYYIELL